MIIKGNDPFKQPARGLVKEVREETSRSESSIIRSMPVYERLEALSSRFRNSTLLKSGPF